MWNINSSDIFSTLYQFTVVFVFDIIYFVKSMYGTNRLTSIPEDEEFEATGHWVSRKKHEKLKSKYHCLKRLFQVYDASLINILPKPNFELGKRLLKPALKDAEANTLDEVTNVTSESDGMLEKSILKVQKFIKSPTIVQQFGVRTKRLAADSSDDNNSPSDSDNQKQSLSDSRENDKDHRNVDYVLQDILYQKQALPNKFSMEHVILEKLQRLKSSFQKRREDRRYPYSGKPIKRIRLKKRKFKIISLKRRERINRLTILPDSQEVETNCLLDTSRRQCPLPGCETNLYGILNYNDHLRLTHFPENVHVCHYCHESFKEEQDKAIHENKHIGILNPNYGSEISNTVKHDVESTPKKEVISEEKLEKLMKIIDQLTAKEDLLNELASENNKLSSSNRHSDASSESGFASNSSVESDSIKCPICGQKFALTKHLKTHINSTHVKAHCNGECNRYRAKQFNDAKKHESYDDYNDVPKSVHKKSTSIDSFRRNVKSAFSKVTRKYDDRKSDDSSVKRRSKTESNKLQTRSVNPHKSIEFNDSICSRLSRDTLDYDPSTNILYYSTSSLESLCKTSYINKFLKGLISKVINSYNCRVSTSGTDSGYKK